MSKKSSNINIDGQIYKVDNLPKNALNLITYLDRIKAQEREKKNMIAILTKAKKAYITELKSEMLTAKSGFDFSD